MRITSTTLRRIIKEELDAVMSEDRAEHVAGIEAKIKRLEAEVDRAQERRDEIGYDPAADDPRTSKTYRELGVRIENMEDKLDTLRKQRAELSINEYWEEEDEDEAAAAPAREALDSCVRAAMKDLMATGMSGDDASSIVFDTVRTAVILAK